MTNHSLGGHSVSAFEHLLACSLDLLSRSTGGQCVRWSTVTTCCFSTQARSLADCLACLPPSSCEEAYNFKQQNRLVLCVQILLSLAMFSMLLIEVGMFKDYQTGHLKQCLRQVSDPMRLQIP